MHRLRSDGVPKANAGAPHLDDFITNSSILIEYKVELLGES